MAIQIGNQTHNNALHSGAIAPPPVSLGVQRQLLALIPGDLFLRRTSAIGRTGKFETNARMSTVDPKKPLV